RCRVVASTAAHWQEYASISAAIRGRYKSEFSTRVFDWTGSNASTQRGGDKTGINTSRYCDAIRDSRIATTPPTTGGARQARMAFRSQFAQTRVAQLDLVACSVRFEICNFRAASLCERLFRARQARSL